MPYTKKYLARLQEASTTARLLEQQLKDLNLFLAGTPGEIQEHLDKLQAEGRRHDR